MQQMKKAILLVLCAVLMASAPVAAATTGSYESVVQQYGDKAQNYIYDITANGEAVKEVISFLGDKGRTYTKTHIRKEPSADAGYITIIPGDTDVVVWGFTSNGWTKVYCKNTDKGTVCGYIRSDLL